ncbi:hypothetical protein [Methylorubrum aminovorans]|uniref:hypothetical protein n=1 Tax=Methylorubrum aminovorans TaxID=269069 RepID=UPI003C2CDD59
MSATRSFWRSLLTVFQIVALVAFSVAGAGHSHAGTAHAGHAAVAAAAHAEAAGPQALGSLADHAEPVGDKAACGACSPCCCHASFLRLDAAAVTVAPQLGRTLSGIPTVAFESVTREMPSEPPRTIA